MALMVSSWSIIPQPKLTPHHGRSPKIVILTCSAGGNALVAALCKTVPEGGDLHQSDLPGFRNVEWTDEVHLGMELQLINADILDRDVYGTNLT
jgi:hypothetical protein